MWTNSKNKSEAFERDYARAMLRSAVVSLFWAVISSRKQKDGMTLSNIAERLGINKSAVSRWFSGSPNWELNTISDLAEALEIELQVFAVERKSGRRFSPVGQVAFAQTATSRHITLTPPRIRMTAGTEIRLRA